MELLSLVARGKVEEVYTDNSELAFYAIVSFSLETFFSLLEEQLERIKEFKVFGDVDFITSIFRGILISSNNDKKN